MARSAVTIQYGPFGDDGERFCVTASANTSDHVTLEALEQTASKAFYKTVAAALTLYDSRVTQPKENDG